MLILGTTRLTFTKSKGMFHCPTCSTQRPYRHRTVRNFFTVYFIPLIPLNQESEYAECQECRGKFERSVIDLTAEALATRQQHAVYELIRRALVTMLAQEDVVSDEELDTVRDFVQEYMQQPIDNDHMLHEAARVQQMGVSAADYIAGINPELDDNDRRLLVRYAFLLASANGELAASQQRLLVELPALLGMSESQFREIIRNQADR